MIDLVGRKVGVARIFKEDGVSVAVATALLVLGSAMPGTVMAAPFKASASAIQPSNEHFVSVAATHSDTNISGEANYNNCCRSRILRNVTAKCEKFKTLQVSHF